MGRWVGLAALSSSPIAPLWAPPPPCDPSRRAAARDGIDLRDTPYRAPRPRRRPSAATAGELVMNIGTPAAGAVIVCRRRAPSRLLTVPSSCPAATASPGLTAG